MKLKETPEAAEVVEAIKMTKDFLNKELKSPMSKSFLLASIARIFEETGKNLNERIL